jgi:epoxide hydrolase 4
VTRFPVRHERFATGELTLHVARAGEGPRPLILLHGFPENWSTWSNQVDALAGAGYHLVMPDMRGYGDSDGPRERSAYAVPKLVEDVRAIAGSSGAPRVTLIGHDWGGVVAWAFARTYPDLLDRLIVLNAPHPRRFAEEVRRGRQAIRSLYALFFQIPYLPERILSAADLLLVRRMFRSASGRGSAVTEEQLESYLAGLRKVNGLRHPLDYYRANWRRAAEYPRRDPIQRPTLVLWGERDPALGPSLLDGLERYVADLTVVRFPEVGHWIQNEAPDGVNRAILDFLAR